MEGDERARFCATCSKSVYNLSALDAAAAAALIEETEGRLCSRIYRRRDGTVLTADCPVGVRGRLRRLAVGAIVGASVLACTAVLRRREISGGGWSPDFTPPPSGPGVTLRDWKDWALESVGWLPRRGGYTVGAVRLYPTSPTSASPAPTEDEGETCKPEFELPAP